MSQQYNVDYSQKGILINTIKKMYFIYCRMETTCGYVTEIHCATEDLVKAYLWLFMGDEAQKKLAIELLILIIEKACRFHGLGYSDNFRAMLYTWILDVEHEYNYPKANENLG